MQVQYRTTNGRMMFSLEASDVKQAFESLSEIQEVFEERMCGRCKSENIKFDVREYDGNSFYKLACKECGAQIDFGQRKDKQKGLFIKKKTQDGQVMPNRGWYVWEGKKS